MSPVACKVLGALILMANDDNVVEATQVEIAHTMGYKKSGGAITYALHFLELYNFINIEKKGVYRILL